MCLYELFLGCAQKKGWIFYKDWPLYLATLETCAREDPDQLQPDLGRHFHEICLRGLGQFNLSGSVKTSIPSAVDARGGSYVH